MTSWLLVRYVHFLGVIFWIGGTVTVALAATSAAEGDRAAAVRTLRAANSRIATPGLALAWLGGLGMLFVNNNFSTIYARAGWMHGKLLLVFIAAGLTGVIAGRLRRASAGEGELGPVRTLGWTLLGITLLVLVLAIWKPGS